MTCSLAIALLIIGAASDAPRAEAAGDSAQLDSTIAKLFPVAEEGADPKAKVGAQLGLAEALEKKGQLFLAALYFSDVLKAHRDPQATGTALEHLVDLQRRLNDPYLISTLLQAEHRDDWPPLSEEAQSSVDYLRATTLYRASKLDLARARLEAVSPKSRVYLKAQYLLGVVLADPKFPQGAEPAHAILAFEKVLNAQSDEPDLERIRQLALLGIGRVQYGQGDYRAAIQAYEKVPRFSAYWDDALFENAFARFRAGDYGGALGSLQALHAPQFEAAFQPESWLLKATVYYFSCLYEEAQVALKAFDEIYLPLAEQLKPWVVDGPADLGEYFRLIDQAKVDRLPRPIYLWVRRNERIDSLIALAAEIEREKGRLLEDQGLRGSIGSALAGYLSQNRETTVQVAGQLVKNRLNEAYGNIRQLSNDFELIVFETTLAEKSLLERGVDQKKILAEQRLYRPPMPSEAWNYWPFEGEFWIDEIGYYQYTLKRGCLEP